MLVKFCLHDYLGFQFRVFKRALGISYALQVFERYSEKLGPTQRHMVIVTCLTFRLGRDSFIGITVIGFSNFLTSFYKCPVDIG